MSSPRSRCAWPARARREAGRDLLVFASQTTLEDCYRPDLVPDDDTLRREHAATAAALAAAGADALLLETFNTVREARIAVEAAVGDRASGDRELHLHLRRPDPLGRGRRGGGPRGHAPGRRGCGHELHGGRGDAAGPHRDGCRHAPAAGRLRQQRLVRAGLRIPHRRTRSAGPVRLLRPGRGSPWVRDWSAAAAAPARSTSPPSRPRCCAGGARMLGWGRIRNRTRATCRRSSRRLLPRTFRT